MTAQVGKDREQQAWSSRTYQVVIVGAGFLADAYDLFVIDMVIAVLSRLQPGGLAPTDKSMVASATLAGAMAGQLLFGLLGDWLGRRWTFLATCVLIVLGAGLSGLVVWTAPEAPLTLVRQLALCRFMLGLGIGGEYPLAAAIAAEEAPAAERGRLVASVFSMQGWGMLLSCVLVLALLAAGTPLELVWRLVLVFGALPSAAVIFLRSSMEETDVFKESQERSGGGLSLSAHVHAACGCMRRYWRTLIGTAMSWLLLDITFYGTGSFKHLIVSSVDPAADAMDDRAEIWQEAKFAAFCSCLAIPGYLLSIAFIDAIGHYNLQFWGFLAMAANFFAAASLIGLGLPSGMRWMTLVCFGLTFLFANFGPNTTTFVLPVEVYPTLVRATCHGISAAAGKLGAVIGTWAFSPCQARFGTEPVLAGCGAVCLLGALCTFFFTPDASADLRELDSLQPRQGRA